MHGQRATADGFTRLRQPAGTPRTRRTVRSLVNREETGRTLARPVALFNLVSRAKMRVEVFQWRRSSLLRYTSHFALLNLTRVKLNRVLFPRCLCQVRSLGC